MTISPKDMKRIMTSPYRLLPVAERYLLENNVEKSMERDKLHLHPSEICKRDWCPRSSYYRILGLPEPAESFTLQRLNVFAEGNLIHQKWQDWLTEAGVMEGIEVSILDEAHRIMGHADGVVNDKHGRAVLEIKSIGIGTVRFEDIGLFMRYANKEISFDDVWTNIRHPFDSHVRQVQLYMHCLDISEGIIIYEWKATQEVKEFSVKFQPEFVNPILASCLSVIRSLESMVAPDRPSWLFREHKVCKSCPFKTECWNEGSGAVNNPSGGGIQQQVSVAVKTSGFDTGDAGEFGRIVRLPVDATV